MFQPLILRGVPPAIFSTMFLVVKANSEGELLEMPIDVVICADTRHVVIRITDLAGGIPRHVGSQIWSSLGVRNWVIGSLGDPGALGKWL